MSLFRRCNRCGQTGTCSDFLTAVESPLVPTFIVAAYDAAADTYGPAAVLSAAAPTDLLLSRLVFGPVGNPIGVKGHQIQLGEGPAGFEVWQPAEFPVVSNNLGVVNFHNGFGLDLPIPIRYAAGARIVCRIRRSVALANGSAYLTASYFPAAAFDAAGGAPPNGVFPFGHDELVTDRSFDEINSTSIPIAVTSGGGAGVPGAYVDVANPTTEDQWIVWCTAGFVHNQARATPGSIEVAFGDPGSEAPRGTAILISSGIFGGATAGATGPVRFTFPIFTPAGTRVRARAIALNAGTVFSTLFGVVK